MEFKLFVTYVAPDGPLLKICGQINRNNVALIDAALDSSRENFKKGVGVMLSHMLSMGMYCIIEYKDGLFYRVKVTHLDVVAKDIVGVYFLDYGSTDVVPLACLRSLDKYDTLLSTLPPQADQFHLYKVMNPGKWQVEDIMRLQSQICFAEYPAVVKGKSDTLTFISILFKGGELSTFILNCLGLARPFSAQVPRIEAPFNSTANFTSEHIPFRWNTNFSLNPASTMRLHQNMPHSQISLGFHGGSNTNILCQGKIPTTQRFPFGKPSSLLPLVSASAPASSSTSSVKSKTYEGRILNQNWTYRVFIPYADKGPKLFAVQLADKFEQLSNLMKAINSQELSNLSKPAKIGTVCLGRMTMNNMMCRAIVMNVLETQCKLYFVDYGCTEVIYHQDIYEIPDEYVAPKVFAVRVCLSQVKILPKGAFIIDTFKHLVKNKVLTLKVVPPEGPPLIQYAELYVNNCNVFTFLAAMQSPKFKKMPMIPAGESRRAMVSYVENSAKFYIQLTSLASQLDIVMDAVKAHCYANAPLALEELALGMECCARYPDDNVWYRARVVAVAGNRITVCYVDYGNEFNVAIKDIRSITTALTELPTQALQCALKDFASKGSDSKIANQLELLVLERFFTVNVLGNYDEETMLVTLVDEFCTPHLDIVQKMHYFSRATVQDLRDMRSASTSKDTSARLVSMATQSAAAAAPIAHSSRTNEQHENLRQQDRRRAAVEWRDEETAQGHRRGGGRGANRMPAPDRARRLTHSGGEDSSSSQASACNTEYKNRKEYNVREFRNGHRGNRGGRARGTQERDNIEHPDQHDRRGQRENRDNRGSREQRNDRELPHSPLAARRQRKVNETTEPCARSTRSADSRRPIPRPELQLAPSRRKELPNPAPLDTPFREPNIELGAQHEVFVTWMTNPDNFFNQILGHKSRFDEMMDMIPTMYRGVQSLTGPVPVGSSVLAIFPEDGVLYRATVIAVLADNQFVVQYIDFGNKCMVNARKLWPVDHSLLEIPRLGVNCGLAGVVAPEGKWQNGADVDACFNAPRYKCVFMDINDGRYKVAMYNNGESVADVLVARGLAEAAPGPIEEVILKDEPIELTLLPGQLLAVRVSHVEGLDKFFVQPEPEKVALVETAIDTLTPALLHPLPEEYLTAGYHCTARVDGRVYRCIVLEVVDSSNVHLVLPDYGRTVTAPADQLMILPLLLSVHFYQAQQCIMVKAQNKSVQQLQELQGEDCVVQVEALDGARLLVRLLEPPSPAGSLLPCPVLRTNFGIAYLSHAASLSSLFLQRDSDAGRIAALLDELYQFYEEGPDGAALAEPAVDTVCAAKSADGNWYRGRVVALRDNACEVHYPDYGNDELIPAENLRRLEPRFLTTAALALPVSLGLEAAGDGALAALRHWCAELQPQVSLSSRLADGRWLASLFLDGVDLAARLVGEELATPLPTEGRIQVYVSHVDSPGQFWLQMPAEVDRIEEIQAELQKDAAAYPALEDREVGAVCAALYSADEQWYRAVLLDADADILTVRFIDYGNTDVLDNAPGALRLLPQNLRDEAPLAVRASLDAVPPGPEWSEEATAAFKRLLGDLEQPLEGAVVLAEPSVTYLDLFAQGANVGAALVAEGLASVAPRPGGELPACFTSHVNSPAEFWLQLASSMDDFDAIDAALAPGEALPLLDEAELSEGCLCAAKFHEDDRWYRAQVVACGSAGTEVLFLDYGNSSISQELRRLPQELVSLPPLARKCALQRPRDVATWPRAAERHFVTVTAEGATVLRAHFVASGDVSIVELFYGEPQRSLTEELVALCEDASVQPESPPDSDEPTKPTEESDLPTSTTVPTPTIEAMDVDSSSDEETSTTPESEVPPSSSTESATSPRPLNNNYLPNTSLNFELPNEYKSDLSSNSCQ